jgi:alpha-ketoglutaric semialdehyde dehydrogenase
MDNTKSLLIGGEPLTTSAKLVNENPSDLDRPVGDYCVADVPAVEQAVAAAQRAFGAWASGSPQVRADLLHRVGAALYERRDAFAELLAREQGKTLNEARGEVERAARIFHYFAGEALRLHGECGPSVRPGVEVLVTREPVGVMALITPWNFPIAIPAWKIAPALACGNSVVVKPAELAPASTRELVALLQECGAPPGLVNYVHGPGSTVGRALVAAEAVKGVSFTGSVAVGRQLVADCALRGKRAQAEMGGKNPWVVLDDADLETAVRCAIESAYYSTGQRCTAASRFIVTRGIHDRFVAELRKRVGELRVGSALDPGTQIGPVVSATQLSRIEEYLGVARRSGATVLGGERERCATRGHFLRPALILDSQPSDRINQEEVFGPVASVLPVDDLDAAVRIANEVSFGLSAGICTKSLLSAQQFMRKVQAGMVMVNVPTAGVDYHAPFGGTKASSLGPREQGSSARDFYTQVKTSYLAA